MEQRANQYKSFKHSAHNILQYVFYILILMCTLQSIVHEEWTVEVFVIQLLRHHNIEEDMVQLLQVVVKFFAHYPHEKPNTKEGVKRIA